MALNVLYEDNHLLALAKPPGLATMGVAPGTPSLLEEAKHYIKEKYGKPGNVYLGIVSRLDAPVTGVVVLARTSKAAARLTEQFRSGLVRKIYWAVVEQPPQPPQGECIDWLRKDERHRRMHVTTQGSPGAQRARLTYRTLRRLTIGVLVEVQLDTGRKHQIRLQLSHRGWPVVGDRKYGATTAFGEGIALHARELSFLHPVRRTEISLVAPLPPSWRRLGVLD